MIYLRRIISLIFVMILMFSVSSCSLFNRTRANSSANNNDNTDSGKKNKSYDFQVELLDFTKKINLLSTYSESSATWDRSTWRKVENNNPHRMILVQCLKNPDNVNLEIFDRLQAKSGEIFEYWLDKGICQYRKKLYAQAYFSLEFSRQFANEKQKKQIDQWVGGLYFKQGYFSKAIEMWTKSKLPNSYSWDTAMANMFNGKIEKSEKYFSKLVKNQQINDSVLLAIAHIKASNSNWQGAQQTLLTVSKKGKKLRKSYYFLQIYLLKKQGLIKQALKLAGKAPKIFRNETMEFAKLK